MTMEHEARISQIKIRLRDDIATEWENLSDALSDLRIDSNFVREPSDAIMRAHKLHGSAGSLGLMKVSAAAGQIEDCLGLLESGDAKEQERLWGEISKCLRDGKSAMHDVSEIVR